MHLWYAHISYMARRLFWSSAVESDQEQCVSVEIEALREEQITRPPTVPKMALLGVPIEQVETKFTVYEGAKERSSVSDL